MTNPTAASIGGSASLAGKYAVVTGGSRGIGAAIAVYLAKKGAEGVAITYVGNKTAAEKIAAEVTALGSRAAIIQADILSDNYGEVVIKGAIQGLNTKVLDVIVNNAAIVDMAYNQPFMDMSFETSHKLFQGNALAPLSVIRSAFPYLPARGGRIINISSVASKEANRDPIMAYGASKAALDSFTRSLAARFAAEKHCTINSVSVGGTETDAALVAMKMMPVEMVEEIRGKQTAERRLGVPEDIAMIVGFLASEESRWINGANVPANGGSVLVLQG
jgi:3-oxoacyl-[acyl-carrier protein] reductase